MIDTQRTTQTRTQRWMILVGVLLAAYLVRSVFAQDGESSYEPLPEPDVVVEAAQEADAPAEPEPAAAPVESAPPADAPPAPVEPPAIVESAPVQPVEVIIEPAALPTMVSDSAVSVPDDAAVNNPLVDGALPESVPTDMAEIVVPEAGGEAVPTVDETVSVLPELGEVVEANEPAPAPSAASVSLVPNAPRLPLNAVLEVNVLIDGLTNAHSLVIVCSSDPTMLRGVYQLPGDLLPSEQVASVDGGYQADGRWVATAVELNPVGGLHGTGAAWRFYYEVIGSGWLNVVCQVQAADVNNQPLPMSASEVGVVIETYQDVVEVITVPSDVTPTAELVLVEPAAPDMLATEEVPMETLLPDVLLEPERLILVPEVVYENPIAVATDEAATASGDVGDLDGNTIINRADAALVTAHYGLFVPDAPAVIDLNTDGVVNLYDLAIVSANLME